VLHGKAEGQSVSWWCHGRPLDWLHAGRIGSTTPWWRAKADFVELAIIIAPFYMQRGPTSSFFSLSPSTSTKSFEVSDQYSCGDSGLMIQPLNSIVPWEIYYASRTRRLAQSSIVLTEEAEGDLIPESLKARRKAARAELMQNELFSLAFCLVSPFLGSYLLYWVRGALSEPDRYINPFNIKLFIMASGVKPWAHFFKLVKNRSLFLHSEVAYPVPTVSILLDQVRGLKEEMTQLKTQFATKTDMRNLREGVDKPLTNLSKAVKKYERKEEYLRLSTEEKFEILHKRQEELIDELIVSNHTIEALRADQERSSSVLRALRYIFSGEGQTAASSTSRARINNGNTRGYVWYERGPFFYIFLPVRFRYPIACPLTER
jgi:hypothetical protein